MESDLGEQNQVENRKRIPASFSLNSKASENGKRSDLRRSCWTGCGLIVEVDVKGRRRVSWDRNKGGVKNFKWVPWACKELGKGKLGLGLGSNKLAAQLPSSKPSLGPNTTSPETFEPGKGSINFVRPISSAVVHEKARESPSLTLTIFNMPLQVAGGPVRTHNEWFQAEKGGVRFSVPLMSPVPSVKVER